MNEDRNMSETGAFGEVKRGVFPSILKQTHADESTQPFWDAAKQNRLVAPKCVSCGTFRLPPSPFCFECQHRDVEWVGLRPLQMRKGSRREQYRVGFARFSGLSKISFADCAHAMLRMLEDDQWIHRAPIIQY
jgi:hypothetical protein